MHNQEENLHRHSLHEDSMHNQEENLHKHSLHEESMHDQEDNLNKYSLHEQYSNEHRSPSGFFKIYLSRKKRKTQLERQTNK